MFFAFNEDKFDQDSKKVLWMSTFLTGTAAHWIEPAVVEYLAKRNEAGKCTTAMSEKTIAIFRSIEGFQKQIKAIFGDINEVETAERAIINIKQQNSVANYTAEFQRYSMRLSWQDDALRVQYYRGLKEGIKDELARGTKSATLNELIRNATDIDNRNYERNRERKGYFVPTHNRKPQYPPQNGHKRGGQRYDPMELDAVEKKTWGPKKKGKGEKNKQKEYRREKGLCYTCGKDGHLARDCSQKKNAAAAERPKGLRKKEVGAMERSKSEDELREIEAEDNWLEQYESSSEHREYLKELAIQRKNTTKAADASQKSGPGKSNHIDAAKGGSKPREVGAAERDQVGEVPPPYTVEDRGRLRVERETADYVPWGSSPPTDYDSPFVAGTTRLPLLQRTALEQMELEAEYLRRTRIHSPERINSMVWEDAEDSEHGLTNSITSTDYADREPTEEPQPGEKWFLVKEEDQQRTWALAGAVFQDHDITEERKPDFVDCVNALPLPANSWDGLFTVVYRDLERIIFQKDEGYATPLPPRYTSWVERTLPDLRVYVEIGESWERHKRIWKKIYKGGETPYEYYCQGPDLDILPEGTPLTLLTKGNGIRTWRDESTGRELVEPVQREAAATARTQEDLTAQLKIMVNLKGKGIQALVDSGAMGNFMSKKSASSFGIQTEDMPEPYHLTLLGGKNAGTDGMVRKRTKPTRMTIRGHSELIQFDIIPTGQHGCVLGTPWIRTHNPDINWNTNEITFNRCDCSQD
jgi:hypothetical protein